MVQKERQGPRTSHRQAPLSCASLAITAQTPRAPSVPASGRGRCGALPARGDGRRVPSTWEDTFVVQ